MSLASIEGKWDTGHLVSAYLPQLLSTIGAVNLSDCKLCAQLLLTVPVNVWRKHSVCLFVFIVPADTQVGKCFVLWGCVIFHRPCSCPWHASAWKWNWKVKEKVILFPTYQSWAAPVNLSLDCFSCLQLMGKLEWEHSMCLSLIRLDYRLI